MVHNFVTKELTLIVIISGESVAETETKVWLAQARRPSVTTHCVTARCGRRHGLHKWRVDASIPNKQSRTADKR
jgi:hypothetical protein